MSEPFIAEIKIYGFNFPPRGFAQCDGQLLPIAQNTALFSLVGTTYGGDGQTNFGLPDLRGRLPAHAGQTAGPGLTRVSLGQKDGVEGVPLGVAQMPAHGHTAQASADPGTTNLVTGQVLANSGGTNFYGSAAGTLVATSGAAVASEGGGQPHDNLQPFLAVNYCIALVGTFPSRN